MEGGGALAALQAMKAHPQEAGVQVGIGTGRGDRSLVGRSGKRPECRLGGFGVGCRASSSLFHPHHELSLHGLLLS